MPIPLFVPMEVRLPVLFIITVAMDSIGVGLLMPIMPDLIREITGQSV